MQLTIRGKNQKITEGIKNIAESKMTKLDKYFNDDDIVSKMLIKKYTNEYKVEITIPTRNILLRAEVMDEDLYNAINLAVDKITGQIRKSKTKLLKHHRTNLSIGENFSEDAHESDILKTKTIILAPMTSDEAVNHMELSDHDFYAYKDIDTGETALVYKRNDRGYGVIELK